MGLLRPLTRGGSLANRPVSAGGVLLGDLLTMTCVARTIVVLLLSWMFLTGCTGQPEGQPIAVQSPRTSLVVLIVVDQFRGDYLTRWKDLLGKDGFRRLLDEGAWFTNCHYPFAGTMTGPGHATLATGCCPDQHGIVANEWYDRSAAEEVNCVTTRRYELVYPVRRPPGNQPAPGASPERLLVETFADALKAQIGSQARVVTLSLKDRGAVLVGGKKPDVCCWMDSEGRLVTSRYYRDSVPLWGVEFVASGFTDRWQNQNWDRLRPDLDYTRYVGEDDAVGEELSRTFPHALAGREKASREKYFAALANSPFGNDLLLELARRAIEEEQLGRRGITDFLSLSFSSNDLVGHAWGPDSHEVLDITLRTDQIIRDLLALLEEQIGKEACTVVLCADHGVCPLPELSRKQGKDARRFDLRTILIQAEEYLNQRFPAADKEQGGPTRWILSSASEMLYLNNRLAKQRGTSLAEVSRELAGWLPHQPGILAAFTHQELTSENRSDELFQMAKRSFHPSHSGDIFLINKPYWLLTGQQRGTSHGSPHAYDTHVPLLVWGQGIKPGVHETRISPEVVPAILAAAAGIKPPAAAAQQVPIGVFAKNR